MRYSGLKISIGKICILFCLLVYTQALIAQKGTKPKDKKPVVVPASKDSVSTPNLEVNTICTNGMYGMLISQPTADTLLTPQYYYIYKINDTVYPADSIGHTAELETILNNTVNGRSQTLFFPRSSGNYTIKAAIKRDTKLVYSNMSDTIAILFCSKVEFPPIFDREVEKTYHPPNLINIQVTSFDIFDRAGILVYNHKNNDISWDGFTPDKLFCPEGIYYFHCEYFDLAANGEVKSISGMIHVKN